MRMLEAMRETLRLAERVGLDRLSADVPESEYQHLVFMLERAETGNFSEGKLGRWLGWMQACVVINSGGEITLEDVKELNRRFS